MTASKKQIVILGGGFAGIYSALSILKACGDSVEITIVNRTNYFLFTPMLHEVATGGLGHYQVVESIREIVYRTPIRFFEASILSVDLAKKEVVTDQGSKPYDMLVVALGASTNYFGTEGAEEHVFVLKDLLNAINIRNHVIDRFEAASHETDSEKRKKILSFVVVGGGATGVEYAAELVEFAKRTLHRYYRRDFKKGECATITLVHSGKVLLGQFSPATQARALKSLSKKGVKVLLNTKVEKVAADHVVLSGGERIETETVVWAAGVHPNQLAISGGEFPKGASGRILSDATLRVQGMLDVFAIGDNAHVLKGDGRGQAFGSECDAHYRSERVGTFCLQRNGKPCFPRQMGGCGNDRWYRDLRHICLVHMAYSVSF
jgi:NADH dehydrogenase